MKDFEYTAPQTLREAVKLLAPLLAELLEQVEAVGMDVVPGLRVGS